MKRRRAFFAVGSAGVTALVAALAACALVGAEACTEGTTPNCADPAAKCGPVGVAEGGSDATSDVTTDAPRPDGGDGGGADAADAAPDAEDAGGD